MLLQIHDGKQKMAIREGVDRMAAEGSLKSFFKGDGSNALKIMPSGCCRAATPRRLQRSMGAPEARTTERWPFRGF